MIQRVQSLYLLLAAALMGLMLCMPIAAFDVVGGAPAEMTLRAFGFTAVAQGDGATTVEMLKSTAVIGIFAALSGLLCLINIFLFKKRGAQYRLCLLAMIFALVVLAVAAYNIFRVSAGIPGFGDAVSTLKPAFFFPLISLVFLWLAMNGILKDIKLVKSLDRIR